MTLPNELPAGTQYHSRGLGRIVTSEKPGRLSWVWGAKGTCGMDPKPYYCVPIGDGLVCDWVPLEAIIVQYFPAPEDIKL